MFAKTQPPGIRRMICSILAGYAWDETNPFVAEPERRLEWSRSCAPHDQRDLGAPRIASGTMLLVTGSSRGIGRAIALRAAADGFDVVVHCRSRREEADAVAARDHGAGPPRRACCSSTSPIAQPAPSACGGHRRARRLLRRRCNAGLHADAAFPAMTGEQWDGVMRTNLDAFYNVLQPVIMPMVRRRAPGRIVTLSSVSGVVGNRGQVNYSAAKAGIIGATKALAVELAKRQITVNCVAPGLIATDMVDEHVPMEEILKAIPAQRAGTAEEVAAAVAFLLSRRGVVRDAPGASR